MKRNILIAWALLAAGSATAQSLPYRPMLQEGKVWHVLHHDYRFNEETGETVLLDRELDYAVRGDSVLADGTVCHRLCEVSDGREVSADPWLEKDGQVFLCFGDSRQLEFDFSLSAGGVFNAGFGSYECTGVDTIFVHGRYFRRFAIRRQGGGWSTSWVEGVGSRWSPYEPLGHLVNDPFTYELQSCYEDGELIFTAEDFDAPAWHGDIASAEYALKTVTAHTAGPLQTAAPLCTAAGYSRMEAVYQFYTDIPIQKGDIVTGVSFRGVNDGAAQTRHLCVWMEDTRSSGPSGSFTAEKWLTKLFDGDCTIRHGGTEQQPEDILDIPFDTPLTFDGNMDFWRLVIVCDDGTPGGEVRFVQAAHDSYPPMCLCASGDEPVGDTASGTAQDIPLTTFHVATPVCYASGTVTDGQGRPIAGAKVVLESYAESVEATTGADGTYRLRVVEGNTGYRPMVTAPGHTWYSDDASYNVKDTPMRNYTLFSSVTYPAGKRSTIVLPVAPDPSAGRYYALDHREDSRFCFRRVLEPEANVPYVLFAEGEDYHVDLAGMDLTSAAPQPVLADGLNFTGTYGNGIWYVINGRLYTQLDETEPATGTALHASLVYAVDLIADRDNYELVFDDGVLNGIADVSHAAPSAVPVFDLQGRRLNGQPRHGLYIRDGRKLMVR